MNGKKTVLMTLQVALACSVFAGVANAGSTPSCQGTYVTACGDIGRAVSDNQNYYQASSGKYYQCTKLAAGAKIWLMGNNNSKCRAPSPLPTPTEGSAIRNS